METNREFSHVVALPQFPGQSIVSRRNASEDPDQGTAETVDRMQSAAIEDSNSGPVIRATLQALAGAQPESLNKVAAIYRYCATKIRFVQDDRVLRAVMGLDNELDFLIHPARLLTMARPAEDCDGFTMLACSMLLAAGVPCEIITIKADPDDPDLFSHVYNEAQLEDGSRVVMDCSQAAQHGYPLGWEAPGWYERRGWGLMQPARRNKGLHGLGVWGEAFGGGDPSGGGDTTDFFYTGAGTPGSIDFSNISNAGFDSWLRDFNSSPGGGGSDWLRSLSLFAPGVNAAVRNATIPPGYALAPNGAIVPAGSLSLGIGSISPTMLILGGGVLLLLLFKK